MKAKTIGERRTELYAHARRCGLTVWPLKRGNGATIYRFIATRFGRFGTPYYRARGLHGAEVWLDGWSQGMGGHHDGRAGRYEP